MIVHWLVRRRGIAVLALGLSACSAHDWPPEVGQMPAESPVLTPEQALTTFSLPPGYRLELVASEPLVGDPVAIDFDADGRMYVVEMRGYTQNIAGAGEDQPVGRIVVLEDQDRDGRMDRSTVFLDSLVMPRAVAALDHGVLVAAPPNLWLARDTDGNLRADTRTLVRDDYGEFLGNPEGDANGLLWGIDNQIHNSNYPGQFVLRDGRLEHLEAPALGQWGVSSDDFGRLYRNSNEDPLHADLVASHYYARNPNLSRPRGIYEELTTNGPVWPIRPTPGINRGYREGMLREDSTLAKFTAAGAPTVYRGDRLPQELRGDVFVAEPAGNLVRRFRVTERPDGALRAENAYERAEFIASTDERFRPVNLYSAPDGTLYVVDMYRGIIQWHKLMTDYLAEQVRDRELEQPIGMGRIYRVVHEDTRPGLVPRLSSLPPAELVRHLEHPNGWWRATAQRLLVERQERAVVPQLRRLAVDSRTEVARLHALWTLDGLGAADAGTLRHALRDASPHVRAASVRIAESRLAVPGDSMRVALLALADDAAPQVRWQLAASLGALPANERGDALVPLLARFGRDSIAVDAAISGLHGLELAALERLLREPSADTGGAVPRLAAAVVRGGRAAEVNRLFGWIGEESRPAARRLALLRGVRELTLGVGGAGAHEISVPMRPQGLLAATTAADPQVRAAATQLAERLQWPGKPRPARPDVPPLTAAEQQRFAAGERLYATVCAACHQPDGRGRPGVAKPLAGSKWVEGEPRALIRILLHGKEGEMLMPPLGDSFSSEETAAVLTYIRRAWGNEGLPITAADVEEVRGYTAGRDRPWTDEELTRVRR